MEKVILPTGHTVYYNIGQVVYMVTDKDQSERILTRIQLSPDGGVLYCLNMGATETWCFGIEISEKRDIIKYMS